jgi:hypothetical protein
VQFDGRAAQFTPTPAAAQAAATQGSIIQYAGGYRGGTETLTAPQALDNVGKNTKVCGLVVSSVHEPEHTFKLTTLYIDKAEDPDFVVYFWHSPLRIGDWPDHADSSIDLTTWFNGKRICVEGRIELYRGTPSINASRWHQYELIQE